MADTTKKTPEITAERLQALVTSTSDVFYRMSPDWSKMLELSGGDFLADAQKSGENWIKKYIHPDDQAEIRATIEEAIQTKNVFELKHRAFTEEGSLVWIFSRAVPLLDADGEIKEWFGIASDITDRQKAEKELQAKKKRTTFMLQLEDDIRGLEDARVIMQIAAESAGEYLNVDRAGYAEMDETGEYLLVKTDWTSGKVPSLKGKLRVEDFGPKLKEELNAGNLVSFSDHLNSAFTDGVESNYAEINNRACIKAPIMRNGEFEALFFVHHSNSRKWNDEEIKLVQKLADRTRHAVKRARAEEALRQNQEQLSKDLTHMRKLHKLFRKLANELDLKTALQKILFAACELSNTHRGIIQLVDDSSDEAYITAHQGYDEKSDLIKHLKESCDLGCDIARKKRKRVITENIKTDPDFRGTRVREIAIDDGVYAQLSTPMITRKGKLVGVLSTQFDEPHHPGNRELNFTDVLAWTAAEFVERYQTDRVLHESKERLQIALESDQLGAWQLKLSDNTLSCTPTCKANFGLSADEELSYERLKSMLHPADRKQWQEAVEKAIKERNDFRAEYRAFGPNDEMHWISVGARALYRQDGTPYQIVGITQNITERKREEANTAFLDKISQNLAGLTNIEETMSILGKKIGAHFNLSACAFAEVNDNNIWEVTHEWHSSDMPDLAGPYYIKEFVSPEILQLFRSEKTVAIRNVKIDHRVDGEKYTALNIGSFAAIPLLHDGEFRYLLAIYHKEPYDWHGDEIKLVEELADRIWTRLERARIDENIRELNETLEQKVEERTRTLKTYQEQLRSLALQLSRAEEEERSRLATELHDNLGQMLSVIKMKMQTIQKEQSSEKLSEAIQLVDDSIQYTRRLMSDLKPPPSVKEKNVGSALKWVINTMDQYGLNVHFDNDTKQEPPIKKEIQTTVVKSTQELLFNVVKHADSDEANLTLSFPDDSVKITVKDHGKGFDPDNTSVGATADGGFGLFHIRERLDVLDGQTDIKSSPGEGTKATLTVPLKSKEKTPAGEQDSGASGKQQEAPAEKTISKIKVLLTDDHKMMRDGLRRIIEEEDGLTVISETEDAETAIDAVREVEPDVVVMDINLPGMNGIEATKLIKKNHPDIKIIGLSFHADDEVRQNMLDAGASAYLEKAEASEELCALIRSEGMAG